MTVRAYLSKMKGGGQGPPGVGTREVFWSWIGSTIGIGTCGYLSSAYFEPRDLLLIVGSLGASCVLVYAAIKSPLAQPRNLIGGHIERELSQKVVQYPVTRIIYRVPGDQCPLNVWISRAHCHQRAF